MSEPTPIAASDNLFGENQQSKIKQSLVALFKSLWPNPLVASVILFAQASFDPISNDKNFYTRILQIIKVYMFNNNLIMTYKIQV